MVNYHQAVVASIEEGASGLGAESEAGRMILIDRDKKSPAFAKAPAGKPAETLVKAGF